MMDLRYFSTEDFVRLTTLARRGTEPNEERAIEGRVKSRGQEHAKKRKELARKCHPLLRKFIERDWITGAQLIKAQLYFDRESLLKSNAMKAVDDVASSSCPVCVIQLIQYGLPLVLLYEKLSSYGIQYDAYLTGFMAAEKIEVLTSEVEIDKLTMHQVFLFDSGEMMDFSFKSVRWWLDGEPYATIEIDWTELA